MHFGERKKSHIHYRVTCWNKNWLPCFTRSPHFCSILATSGFCRFTLQLQCFVLSSSSASLFFLGHDEGASETAESVKCSLCKHKDLSSSSRTPQKQKAQWHILARSALGQGGRWMSLLASQTTRLLSELQVRERTSINKRVIAQGCPLASTDTVMCA